MSVTLGPVAGRPTEGTPFYSISDHAFNFDLKEIPEGAGHQGHVALLLNTLGIEVAIASSRCLYVSGYCPAMGWTMTRLAPPAASFGALSASSESRLVSGTGMPVDSGPWIERFDPSTGWFCSGREETEVSTVAVEFATDTQVVLHQGRLLEVWIRPMNWEELARSIGDAR
ncbi:MAG: hypothetical protein WDA27_11125 [Actinomycetota bacterium]